MSKATAAAIKMLTASGAELGLKESLMRMMQVRYNILSFMYITYIYYYIYYVLYRTYIYNLYI